MSRLTCISQAIDRSKHKDYSDAWTTKWGARSCRLLVFRAQFFKLDHQTQFIKVFSPALQVIAKKLPTCFIHHHFAVASKRDHLICTFQSMNRTRTLKGATCSAHHHYRQIQHHRHQTRTIVAMIKIIVGKTCRRRRHVCAIFHACCAIFCQWTRKHCFLAFCCQMLCNAFHE